jgi:homoserine kinase
MIKVTVPATSANCCVGFDCMGLALTWSSLFTFEESDTFHIEGVEPAYRNEHNLIVRAFRHAAEYLGKPMPTLSVKLETTIPFQRGLGSSATCVVAGIYAADLWYHAQLDRETITRLATEMEGHPDNAAPAVYGNLCISNQGDTLHTSVLPCADWKGLAMVPDYPVRTKEARKVLPASILHQQASKQVAHAMMFVQALQTGRQDILLENAVDYLHQPYRKKLIKEFDAVHDLCTAAGVPMWISGSGSTMLAVSMSAAEIDHIKNEVETRFGITCRPVQIARKGASAVYE